MNTKTSATIKMIITGLIAIFATNAYIRQAHVNKDATLTSSVQAEIPDLQVGQLAPNFSLPDLGGRMQTFSSQRGGGCVLAFFCGCSRCRSAAIKIAAEQRQHKIGPVTSVVALVPGAAQVFQSETGIRGMMLTDPSDTVAGKYQSSYCPRLWAISSSGTILYLSDIALEGQSLTDGLAALHAHIQPRIHSVKSPEEK